MSSFIPKDGVLYDMFLNSKQARLSMAAHAVIIAIMLVGTVLARSTSLLALTLTLIIAMLLTSYKINCMVVGNCTTWAWIEAGVASLSVVIWVIGVLRVLQHGGTIEGAVTRVKQVSGGRRRRS
jgi:hypothetical protein